MTTSFEQPHHMRSLFTEQQELQLTSSNSSKNNENIGTKLIISSRTSSGTPKRRLSYQNMNSSSPSSQPSKLPTPGLLPSCSTNDLSPLIKRKCLTTKEPKPIKFSTVSFSQSIMTASDSPYIIASDNLNNESIDQSPKNLNDSFETMQLSSNKFKSKFVCRRRILSKHKSAPLSNLTQQLNNISSPISKLQYNQPLNDISNHMNKKVMSNSSTLNGFKMPEPDSTNDDNRDDVTELENLIFGTNNSTSNNSINQNNRQIQISLEIDSQVSNLIGDRTRSHILPAIVSKKHQDLCCISPQTLVSVLDGEYQDQIKEVIIIDSRYPYEYEGGHITHALNIYTKERLYDEMFIKRSHKNTTNMNNSTMDMDTSVDSDQSHNSKRTIIIFHCEFSSERGPSLLRFLRNSDRTLNENCYPNLFYPELYLLEGGYKVFYEGFKNYCDPQTYKPMLHAEHSFDYKHFRAKAKSWEVSRHHIVYKYNEHLQRQKSLHTQKEQHEQETIDEECVSTSSRRIVKMKAKF